MTDDKTPDPSRPTQAKRHLRVVSDAQETQSKKKRTRSAPDIQTGLTEKQTAFVAGVEKGLSLSDAYRAAYDASGMADKTVHEAACRLFSDSKITARLKQIAHEKAEQLRMMAASDAANAVDVFRRMSTSADTDASKIRAAELLAKASGVFTEKVEVTDKTDRSVSEIEQALRERLGKLGISMR